MSRRARQGYLELCEKMPELPDLTRTERLELELLRDDRTSRLRFSAAGEFEATQ